jgi:hypothetical protein
MDLGETEWGGIDRISLALDREKWRALMNVGFHKMLGISRVAVHLVVSRVAVQLVLLE